MIEFFDVVTEIEAHDGVRSDCEEWKDERSREKMNIKEKLWYHKTLLYLHWFFIENLHAFV